MKHSILTASLIYINITLLPVVHSAPVTFDFQSTLSFESATVVSSGGATIGDVFDAIYGAGTGASGKLSLTGSLTYESCTPGYENYLSPVTGLHLNVNGIEVDANIPSINVNNNLSILAVWGI